MEKCNWKFPRSCTIPNTQLTPKYIARIGYRLYKVSIYVCIVFISSRIRRKHSWVWWRRCVCFSTGKPNKMWKGYTNLTQMDSSYILNIINSIISWQFLLLYKRFIDIFCGKWCAVGSHIAIDRYPVPFFRIRNQQVFFVIAIPLERKMGIGSKVEGRKK